MQKVGLDVSVYYMLGAHATKITGCIELKCEQEGLNWSLIRVFALILSLLVQQCFPVTLFL